ncbi:Uncharacterised protein [Enterobacter cloacae]|nr:Uncharacterised protein [Enterobacter cloacae]
MAVAVRGVTSSSFFPFTVARYGSSSLISCGLLAATCRHSRFPRFLVLYSFHQPSIFAAPAGQLLIPCMAIPTADW